jgi:hypothetical protein
MTAQSATRQASSAAISHIGERWNDIQANALIRQLSERLGCSMLPAEAAPTDDALVRFTLDLSHLHLHGLDERTTCALLGEAEGATLAALDAFALDAAKSIGFPFVFCLTADSYAKAHRIMTRQPSMVLGPEDLAALIDSSHPLKTLLTHVREQIDRLALSAYNILRPADSLFFGREREQARLFEDLNASYAIAGPGRIGKSSLLKRHARNIRRSRDPRSTRLFEIDFMPLGRPDDDEVAQYIAMRISGNSRSYRTTTSGLTRFLRHCRAEFGGPLELLLDETDLVCEGEAFRQLGWAAKEGYVRLVLCGRQRLFEFSTSEASQLGHRLTPMLLTPLADAEAQLLIRLPLDALGVSIPHDSDLIRHITDQTGRLPHLLQFYCKSLVELTVDHQSHQITAELVEELESQGEFFMAFLGPLEELGSGESFSLAAALLRDGRDRFELAQVRDILIRLGRRDHDPISARRACDALVIHNILVWDQGGYRVANHAIRRFAKQAGLLD